jgi:hypothetical protein
MCSSLSRSTDWPGFISCIPFPKDPVKNKFRFPTAWLITITDCQFVE